MTLRKTMWPLLAALLLIPGLSLARQNLILNGSMEAGEGPGAIDPQIADQWLEFGLNVERSGAYNLVPPGEGHALKAFGDSDSTSAGASQIVADVVAGQSVAATVQLFSPANDKLGGSAQAGIVLEFLNLFGGTISIQSHYPFTAGSPADTWITASVGPLTAPAGTTKVRVACKLNWTAGAIFGAVYWDDAQLIVDDEPAALLNGDFEEAGPSPGQSPVGIDEWMGFEDQEKSEDVAEHGMASLKLGASKQYSGLYQNMGTLNAGDHIFMIAYAWNPSDDPLTGSSRVGIKLEFDPSTEVPPPEENLAFDETFVEDEWTLVELSTIVPEEATIARVVCIYVGDSSTTGSVHFDTAYAERGSFPGVNRLLNDSFEDGPGGLNGLAHWQEFSSPPVSECQKSCFEVEAVDGICTARGEGQSVAGVYQEITVIPGETLDIGAYLLTPSFEPLTGTGKAGIKVEWAVGGIPPDVDIGGPNNTIDASAPTDTWIPLFIDYTMPAGASALGRYVNIIERGSALSGTVYLDSCEAVVLNGFDGSDVDGDDDADLVDFTWLQRTFTGPGAGGLPFNGITFDHDDDEDVDTEDYEYFEPRMTGP